MSNKGYKHIHGDENLPPLPNPETAERSDRRETHGRNAARVGYSPTYPTRDKSRRREERRGKIDTIQKVRKMVF